MSADRFPYTVAATMMLAIFPPWSLEGGLHQLIERLKDDRERARIRVSIETVSPTWPPWREGGWPHNLVKAVGWDRIRVSTVGSDRNRAAEGINVSPDGQWLVFDSNRSGNQDIYKMPLGGGEPLQLTTDPADDFIPAFSPDGKEIVFYSFRTGNRDIFVMSSEGGTEHQLTRNPASDQYPIWSPEGKTISFQSDRGGRMEVYVISANKGELEGGTPVPLTSEGGSYAKWSPDGTSIAYAHQGVSVVDVNSGDSRALVGLEDELVKPAWSPEGQSIYYLSFDRENRASIGSIPASGGDPTLLVRFDDPDRVALRREWAVGAGRFFFTLTEHESDIWVMDLEPAN